jgi:hypothetical protein
MYASELLIPAVYEVASTAEFAMTAEAAENPTPTR